MRFLAAYFAAVLDACLAAGLAIGLFEAVTAPAASFSRRLWLIPSGMLMTLLFGGAIAIAATLLLGLPMHAVLSWQGRTSVTDYALAGGIAGGVLSAVLAYQMLAHPHANNGIALMLAIGLPPGAIAAAISFRRVLDGGTPL